MAFVVADGENANAICENAVADGVGETFQVGFPTAIGGEGEGLWIGRDQAQGMLDFLEEVIAEFVFALVVPGAGGIDFALDGFVVGELHA